MQLNNTHVKGKWSYFRTNWGLSDLVSKEISTVRHPDPLILGFVNPIRQDTVQKKITTKFTLAGKLMQPTKSRKSRCYCVAFISQIQIFTPI